MAPYLQSVFEKKVALGEGKLESKDLFELNEAVFNLDKDETLDQPLVAKIFSWVQRVQKAFVADRAGKGDSNFKYDLVGLLGTLQSQAFFSAKQAANIQLLLLGVLQKGQEPSKLEAENAQLRRVLDAVEIVQGYKKEQAKKDAKDKDAGKDKEEKQPKKKGKGGKQEAAEPAKAPEPAKEEKEGKKKGKKAKGSKKGDEAQKEEPAEPELAEEAPKKGKKAKGNKKGDDKAEKAEKPKEEKKEEPKEDGAEEGGKKKQQKRGKKKEDA